MMIITKSGVPLCLAISPFVFILLPHSSGPSLEFLTPLETPGHLGPAIMTRSATVKFREIQLVAEFL